MINLEQVVYDCEFDLMQVISYLDKHKVMFSLKINEDKYNQEDVVLRVGNQEVLGIISNYIIRNVYFNVIN